MPAASAAVIYFIRTAVISRLPEPGQRQLLTALATAASHAIAAPVIVAAMEGCGVLLELLGRFCRDCVAIDIDCEDLVDSHSAGLFLFVVLCCCMLQAPYDAGQHSDKQRPW
jgi:hypothetical protein